MNKYFTQVLLFLSVFFIIFNQIPKILRLNFISGGFANKLSFYPLFILGLYLIYEHYKEKMVLINSRYFSKYIAVYFFVILFSTVLGLINYPYYNIILNGPVNQIEKLPLLVSFLSTHGIFLENQWLLSSWMIVRIIKNNIITLFYTFIFSYVIYVYTSRNSEQAFYILKKAIYCSIAVLFLYSSFEILYLANNDFAKNILEIITPYIHAVRSDDTWWPPLLWKGQLRSVYAEPSYFGMYAAFAMPFLWHDILLSKKWEIVSVITILFSFLLFLTKARTAFVLHMGELLLLVIAFLIYHKQIKFKQVLCVLMCSLISFMGANLFLRYTVLSNNNISQQIDIAEELSNSTSQYLDDNAKTLADPDARSNGARYSVIIANLRIGMQHPILGVGSGLKNAYITDTLPEMGLKNREVKMWMKNQAEKGILKSGYPNLCEYATRFAETGVIGIIVFLFPMLYLIFMIVKKIRLCVKKRMDNDKVITYITFLISFLGICATGLGDSLDITYCYWILLGLGYAMCYEDNKKKA